MKPNEGPRPISDTIPPAPNWPDEPCGDCHGSGKCPECDGSGIVTKQDENERLLDTMCRSCEGDTTCWTCGGTGIAKRD